MKKAIILTDGKAGHENQSKAFARALGCEAELVPVSFRCRFRKALSYLLDHLGIRTLSLFNLPPSFAASPTTEGRPAVVIGTGSGTFYAAKALARALKTKCAVVLYPRGYDIASFDCVLAPAFDNPPPAPNVITIPANLVANDAAFYDEGVRKFEAHYAASHPAPGTKHPAPGTIIGVIVGGPNKCSTMTPEWMKAQLDRVFAAHPGAAFWVTTSRRTPPAVEAVVDSYPWDYRLLYSKDHFNPIPAFVKLCSHLYVTAESTGMLSESCTCGTSVVHALDNLNPGPHKFRRFVEGLVKGGYLEGSRKVDLSAEFAHARQLLGL